MKYFVSLLGFIFLFFAQGCLLNKTNFLTVASADESWKNWYGIAWRDTPANHMKYAKQMGHDYIGIANWRTPSQYRNDANAKNLSFYFVEPWSLTNLFEGIAPGARKINEGVSYTAAQKAWYENYMVWKSYNSFPQNLASGVMISSKVYDSMWDFQQQVVIDKVVDGIIAEAKRFDDPGIPFTFAGYMIDSPKLKGLFYRWDATKNRGVSTDLSYWTGMDSGLIHGTITHEYATYSDGMAAFYKQLNTRMRQAFPNAKWILEPYNLYKTTGDEWIYQVKNRADKDQLTPDMLVQEGSGTEFVDNSNIFNSGMNITKDMVGITQPNHADEDKNRLYAAKAGINGAWYNWFGRFGGSGPSAMPTMPSFQSIIEVYPRLKLIRLIPNWDNLNNVPLIDRSWDGSVYQSTKSYISSDVMYSRHPKTGKLFAVFNTTNGVIKLNAGETVSSVQRVDGYFIEAGDASSDFNIYGTNIYLKSSVTIDVDSSNGQVKGNGYIFTISSSSSTPSGSLSINSGAAYTKSANVTLNLSATDDVDVTGYYLSTSSTAPSATAAGWTAITSAASYSASVSYTLNSGNGAKTIYAWYKDSGGNVSGTASDSITLDTTVPSITITSPTSNATYSTTSSTVSLGGAASDATSGVGNVMWSNSRGGSGTASGTTSWSISSISLSSGSNVITVTVTDGAGNTGMDTITVTYSNTTPSGSLSINSGAAYTKSTNVTLNLSATDDVGVTGYYLSTSSTAPSATAAGWTAITSTASYSASVSYTLNSGNGAKTLYVWYKDAAGNVSGTASDSITLDTTVPSITITSPTSNATYSTTSSTVSLGGATSDATSGVGGVTWSNSRGGSGTASGTTSWSISSISLSSGSNVITVTVTDGAGNTSTATITVTYNAVTAPTVTTGSATNITTNSVTLSGTVNANGQSTTIWFKYGTTSGSLSNTSSTQVITGSGDVSVSIDISGLSPSTTYYYRVFAQNSAGITRGSELSFTTYGGTAPTVTTGSATNITTNSVTLNGTVNANWQSTTIWFKYGTTSGSLSNTSSTQVITGSSDVSVSIDISGLSPSTTYYYRVFAQNSAGTTPGSELSFTTYGVTAPTALTGSVTNVTTNSVTLNGTVNASGQSTTIWFKYGTTSGSLSNTSSTQVITGTSDVSVSIDISGLSPSTTYYYRVFAQNSAGTTRGSELSFTTYGVTAPTVTTGSATNITTNSVTLNGTVNASGQSTTIWFKYGTTSGSLSNTSSTQVITGSSDVSVSIDISGLSPSTTYYYRVFAQNSAGITRGSELSFTTSGQ